MKIAQTSDTHIGLTKPNTIKKLFIRMKKEDPDIFLLLGDFCGGYDGARSVRSTFKLLREIWDGPVVACLGNHDYWCTYRKRLPSLERFNSKMDEIKQTFEDYNVHFLDKDGVYRHPDHEGVAIVGHTGWYSHPNPSTNDSFNLPMSVAGDTNRWMRSNYMAEVESSLNELTDKDTTRLYASHFPVIKVGNDRYFERFSDSEVWGQLLKVDYNINKFANGHAHQLHEGEHDRYEAGSDYGSPNHIVYTLVGGEYDRTDIG